MKNELKAETSDLIERYFDAFKQLYGIISMKRALRIIREQNPDICISDEMFADYIKKIDYGKKHYIIVYDSEMYSNDPSAETNALKKYLITEFLYCVDDEAYDEMKEIQDGFRFYIPPKDELLKYSDDFYYEQNQFHIKMKEFLVYELHINVDHVDDIVDEWVCMWRASTNDDVDIEYSIDRMAWMSYGKFKDFKSKKQADEFCRLFADMYNNTRLLIYRGNTPKEVNQNVECNARINL